MYTSTVVVITAILPVALFALRTWLLPKPIPGIPHNEVTSILGDIPAFAKSKKNTGGAFELFESTARRLGPIYQVFLGPFEKIVVISDPQEIEDLLLQRGRSWDRDPMLRSLFAGVMPFSQISMSNGEEWKKHRRILLPSMTPGYLKNMTPRITAQINQLVGLWKDKSRIVAKQGGDCFASQMDLQLCTMDLMGNIAFGEGFDALAHTRQNLTAQPPLIDEHGGATFPHLNSSTSFHAAFQFLFGAMQGILNFPPFLFPAYWFCIKLGKQWKSSHGMMTTFVSRRIVEAKARAEALRAKGIADDLADCLVDMIMEREGKDDRGTMTDTEIRDELMGMVFGGQESTASAVAFGLKYFSNNPEVQMRLYRELTSKLDSPLERALTYDDVVSSDVLPYLEAVVTEILRCSTVAPATSRVSSEDMIVLGHTIPKGTMVQFMTGFAGREVNHIYGLESRKLDPVRSETSQARGFSKNYWDDHDTRTFKPERWLVEVDGFDGKVVQFSAKQGWSMPFGLGQRSCFGPKLAMLDLKLIIATLNLSFFFDKVPEPLNGFGTNEVLVTRPKDAYVAPREWRQADWLAKEEK